MKCERAGHFYGVDDKKKKKESASPRSGLRQFVVSRDRSNPDFQPHTALFAQGSGSSQTCASDKRSEKQTCLSGNAIPTLAFMLQTHSHALNPSAPKKQASLR